MNSTVGNALHVAGLAAADHRIGSEQARWQLLEYGDYVCSSCAEAEPLTQHLIETFGTRLQFVFRHFPLVELHPHAELAAEAAEAAAAQDKFWPMHHMLFAHSAHLKPATIAHCAESSGLDMIRFHAEMADRIYTQRVHEHRRSGERAHLRGSPTFFLNGDVVDVSFGLDLLERTVRSALGER